jgi:hypothetical protein
MEKKRPNVFIIPGMPRCATTFLYHNLQKHPSVFCPFRKETNYFSVNYHKGIDWYRHLYREIRPGQIGADVSPSYLLHKINFSLTCGGGRPSQNLSKVSRTHLEMR